MSVNSLYERVRKERSEKVSKKDIRTVWDAIERDDFNKVYGTKLYTKQSGAYCTLIELLYLIGAVNERMKSI